jgi:predicted transcriptional regulator
MELTMPPPAALTDLTLKLDRHVQDTLQILSAQTNKSTHVLIVEAIHAYLNAQAAEDRFIAAAQNSLKNYQQTGLHITLDEFSDWTKSLRSDASTPMPRCHA